MRLVFRKDRPGKPGTDCLVQNMELGENVVRETVRTHELKGQRDGRPSDYRRLYNSIALGTGQLIGLSAAFIAAVLLGPVSVVDQHVLQASRILIPVWFLAAAGFGLFPGWGLGTAEELRRLVLALAATTGATMLAVFFSGAETTTITPLFALVVPLGMLFVPIGHHIAKSILIRMGQYGQAVVIYGAGKSGRHAARTLIQHPGCGYRPVAYFDDHPGYWGAAIHGIPVLGDMNIVLPEARMAILALSESDPDYHRHLLESTLSYYDDVVIIPNDDSLPDAWDGVLQIETVAGLHISRRSPALRMRVTKRIIDLIILLVSLPVWAPVLAALSIVARVQSGRKAVTTYNTAGLGGEAFDRYRFDAPETDFGDWLIYSGLVDLPEIINVISGQMSLVGPQPLAPEAEPDFLLDPVGDTSAPKLLPGMTGTWRVTGEYSEEFYARNRSFWVDLVIILRTLKPRSLFSRSRRNE